MQKRFFKFPIMIYKSSDMEKYLEISESKEEIDPETDIDAYIEKNLKKSFTDEEFVPRGYEVMCRIDPQEIISYRPVWGLESTDEEIEESIFNNTLIVTKTEEFISSWDIGTFEDHFFSE